MSVEVPIEAHSVTTEYREKVISAQKRDLLSLPQVLLDAPPPATHVLAHHSLGLGVTSPATSIAWYARLGFEEFPAVSEAGAAVRRLRAPGGLLVDLIPVEASAPLPVGAAAALSSLRASSVATGAPPPVDPTNVLMDVPSWKPPGHTHASWSVPSVPAAKAFLEGVSIPLSGTRSTLAVFVRDPDRTTLEFERNDGVDEPSAFTGANAIGFGRPLDHVGVRIRAPYDRHLAWWARMMGFNRLAHMYETSADPQKNFAPIITRTDAHCDVNFIPNATSAPPAAGKATEAVLWEGGCLRPGILWVGYEIAEAAAAAHAALRAAGADAILDSDLIAGKTWGDFPAAAAVRALPGGPTVFLRDLNGSIIRLVPRQ